MDEELLEELELLVLDEELLVLDEELLVLLLELEVELLEDELLELDEELGPPQDSTNVQELSLPGTVVVYQLARYLLL